LSERMQRAILKEKPRRGRLAGASWVNQRRYRSYDDAIRFVHPLKLKNHDPDWLAYCRGERKDLPLYPLTFR
jgi:hypothetical protein